MTGRRKLLNRHASEIISFDHGGHKYHAQIARHEDGRVAELFLNTSKAGTDTQVFMRDASIILSLALQYGANASDIRKSLTRNANGSAAGPIGKILDMLEKEGAL